MCLLQGPGVAGGGFAIHVDVAYLVVLDEVAAHLDADRRAALYDEICTLGAQALMTGTEPGLFDALGPRGQTFAVADVTGISQMTTG